MRALVLLVAIFGPWNWFARVLEPTPLPVPSKSDSAAVTPAKPKDGTGGQHATLLERRWHTATLRGSHMIQLDKAVFNFTRNRSRYEAVQKMRAGGVPAQVVFTLHGRESTWSFSKHLHEGSPLLHRTRWIPKGRLPLPKEPPFTFEQSAEDALYILKSLHRVQWGKLHNTLDSIETYNGLGYRKYHTDVPSPYLWSGTDIYERGKYTADSKFSKVAVDKQLGCAAILLRMKERGIKLPFE